MRKDNNITQSLKIVIFDGSLQTTPFINRLISGLSKRHQVFVLGFNETLSNPIKNVHYITLGSNTSKLRLIRTSLWMPIKFWRWGALPKVLRLILGKRRAALQQLNLKLVLDHIEPDIIHLQWPSVIPWFESVLDAEKIPVILSQRGYHINVRPFVKPDNFEYLQTWLPRIRGFHSVSKAISAQGNRIYESPDKLDHVIYTGLPMDAYEFDLRYQKAETLQILSVGRSHWKKGYDFALKACKILKDKGIKFSYTIVGVNKMEELLYIKNDLNLDSEVQLIPKLEDVEIKASMRTAHVLLVPSLEEGIANVAAEAMAIGLPVIATKIGGMPELISNAKNGWLVPPRDVDAIADNLISFSEATVEDIEEIRKAARQTVEREHSILRMIAKMESLYKEALMKPAN